MQAEGVFELNTDMAESNINADLLLTLAQFPSARKIHSKQSHDAIDDLSHISTQKEKAEFDRHTSSLKSLSSANRSEHSLISSICKKSLSYKLAEMDDAIPDVRY